MEIDTGDDCLFIVFFADDQVVLANDEEGMSYMLRKLEEEYCKWGLTINMDKTRYVVVDERGVDLLVRPRVVQNCGRVKYLGTLISEDKRCEVDIRARTGRGRSVIRWLNGLLCSSEITERELNVCCTLRSWSSHLL